MRNPLIGRVESRRSLHDISSWEAVPRRAKAKHNWEHPGWLSVRKVWKKWKRQGLAQRFCSMPYVTRNPRWPFPGRTKNQEEMQWSIAGMTWLQEDMVVDIEKPSRMTPFYLHTGRHMENFYWLIMSSTWCQHKWQVTCFRHFQVAKWDRSRWRVPWIKRNHMTFITQAWCHMGYIIWTRETRCFRMNASK